MIFTRLQRFNHGAASQSRRTATLRDELDNLFQQAFGRPFATSFGPGQLEAVPALDLYEDKDRVTAKVELPGMKKEDIGISLEDGVLTISGERKQDPQYDSATVCRCERVLGQFERRVSLPCKVDAEKIQAAYTDGVLTVTLPKAEEAKPKQIQINIK